MIRDDEITMIGTFLKPHGIKGEINFETDFDIDLSELKCLVLKIDGINVPFFIDSFRRRSSYSYLVLVDGINSDLSAKKLCGESVYALNSDLPETEVDEMDGDRIFISDLIGFEVIVDNETLLGEIIDYDDSTDNVLIIVKPQSDDRKQLLIPIADEFISEMDFEKRQLRMNLPDGLIELNN